MAIEPVLPMSDEVLLERAADGDIGAMQELARRDNEEWKAAFRDACMDVLGEDPNEWGG